jgi:hypothetical protein
MSRDGGNVDGVAPVRPGIELQLYYLAVYVEPSLVELVAFLGGQQDFA